MSWGVEVEHDLSCKDDGVTGSVDVSAMPTVSMSPLDVQNPMRFSVSAGLSRQLEASSSVDINPNACQPVYFKGTDLTLLSAMHCVMRLLRYKQHIKGG